MTNSDGRDIPLANPLAHYSAAKRDLAVIKIARVSVLTGDVEGAIKHLMQMSDTCEDATRWEGTLTFAFDGWDNDCREIPEIPEIRAWFAKLTGRWPYWFHFAEKVGDTIPLVLKLLCRGQMVAVPEEGMVGWKYADQNEVKRVMHHLFGSMNQLYFALGLPETMNARVTDEVAQLLVASMD